MRIFDLIKNLDMLSFSPHAAIREVFSHRRIRLWTGGDVHRVSAPVHRFSESSFFFYIESLIMLKFLDYYNDILIILHSYCLMEFFGSRCLNL